ncbi:MAG: hypothetical protein JXP73_10570 [Deltaproteobacteria bacterium]|nr:hypothetical protein [Deltaproteobacteria bacterium]
MRRPLLTLALALSSATPAACAKNKPDTTSPKVTHVPGTPHTDEVLTAWRNAGLAPEGFSPMPPPPDTAVYCEHGTVRGVDTTICEYDSDQALTRGVQQVRDGWVRIDAHTGVILRAKRTTMAAVDRERREPSGKTINEMAKVFGKL